MPTYDYICTSCNNAWELEQRIVEDPIKVCPKCGAASAKRQISAGAGFILKGGGWYADGYGSAKAAASSDEGSPGKAEKSDKGDKKAEASTAAPAQKAESSTTSESAPAAPAAPAKPSAA